jgi:predicted ATP-binding protein involved in virulence
LIPLVALSSGEQHQLVLYYQLLFKTNKHSLIMIDEPEISLHIAWQKLFLKDLQEVIAHNPFDALIATHSPQIIHDRWDLTASLDNPKQ